MEAIRNIHFTQLIRISNRLYEFNFRKRGAGRYDGDVSGEYGKRHYFTLVKENENWMIKGPDIIAWLRTAEDDIIKSIAAQD